MSRRTQEDFERAVEEHLGAHALTMDLDAFQCSWLLHEAALVSRRQMERIALKPLSLSWTQFELLWHLWLFEEDETRFVAEAIAISKGSLTEAVTALQTRGLVQRRTPDSDRRSVLISITGPGQALVVQAIPKVNDVESQIVASLDAPTKRHLISILREVLDHGRRSPPPPTVHPRRPPGAGRNQGLTSIHTPS